MNDPAAPPLAWLTTDLEDVLVRLDDTLRELSAIDTTGMSAQQGPPLAAVKRELIDSLGAYAPEDAALRHLRWKMRARGYENTAPMFNGMPTFELFGLSLEDLQVIAPEVQELHRCRRFTIAIVPSDDVDRWSPLPLFDLTIHRIDGDAHDHHA